ncbi:hypothetical protein JHK84_045457 [Glycine max]|nr:hypothetical protein JHK86_045408 [Glycine max]KAG5108550.1 hypothetical protein JHK84_045457 [Glycine max]
MSICTNCAILAWLYDEEGKWKIEPGLAAILIMEHVLLLTKFGFSRFFPEVIVLLPKMFGPQEQNLRSQGGSGNMIFKSGPLFISSKGLLEFKSHMHASFLEILKIPCKFRPCCCFLFPSKSQEA